MNNQVIIEEESTTYKVSTAYHSNILCENFDAKIKVTEHENGRMTIKPHKGDWHAFTPDHNAFMFDHSDPDRVIAIAQMMMAAAQMVKNHNQKPIGTSDKA